MRLFSQDCQLHCTQILPGQGHRRVTILITRKHWATDGEDCIPLRSLILMQYQSMMDRQTDRQTNTFVAAYTVLAKLGLRSAVKINTKQNLSLFQARQTQE